jgi:tRNA(Ile)-lysidine synthase
MVKAKSALLAKVEQFLSHVALDSQPLVVAVSGGPDSVALLHALAAFQVSRPASIGSLVIAHLNHQLRGADSDADACFVQQLHNALKAQTGARLEILCQRIDVGARAGQQKANLESLGRKVRYDWLSEVARSVHAPFVATGHTADDQAETVLHRLLRGTGLKGLRGIAARRTLAPGTELIRPLLRLTRSEVLAYLKEEGQAYREDASNSNRNYTRNRIRHELLPYLAQRYNPAIASILGRLAEQASQAYQDQEMKAGNLLAEAERPRAGTLLVLAAPCLAAQPRHLVSEVFRLLWTREGWPLGEMGFRQWDQLAAVTLGDRVAVDLPGGIRARRRDQVIQIGRPVCGERGAFAS